MYGGGSFYSSRNRDHDRDHDRDRDGRGGYRDRGRDYDSYGGRRGYERGQDSDRDRRFDQRSDDYRRSRKDSPPSPLRRLDYDDNYEDRHNGPARGSYSSSEHRSNPGRDSHSHDAWTRPGSRLGDDRLDRQDRLLGDSDRDRRPVRHDRDPSPVVHRRADEVAPGGHAGRSDYNQHRDSFRSEVDADRRLSHGREGPDLEHYRSRVQAQRGSENAVVLRRLPKDATENDIYFGLDYITRERNFSHDKVVHARLHNDQNGRLYASVEFRRRADTDRFLDEFSPSFSFPLQSRGAKSNPITVRVESAIMPSKPPTSRDSYGEDEGERWECTNCDAINFARRTICYKCKEERTQVEYRAPSAPVLTGETDECPQQRPSQYVVIRGLDRPVSEEVLAKGIMKLFVENTSTPKETVNTTTNKLKSTAPTNSTAGLGAKPGSLRRVFLMRDRHTNESWKYGFAEFATVEDAAAAVAKFRASPKFTISSKHVVVAFIHTGVFVPAAPNEHADFYFTPIYNRELRLKYWDDRAYPNVHVVTTDPIPDPLSPKKDDNDEPHKSGPKQDLKKMAKKDKEMSGAAPKIVMMPQVQKWAKASAELHGVQPKQNTQNQATQADSSASLTAPSLQQTADPQPNGPYGAHARDEYTSYADWESFSCVICKWTAPTDESIKDRDLPYTRNDLLILHEGDTHSFYRDPQVKDEAAAALSALKMEPRTISRRAPRLKSENLPVYKSYVDFDRLRCVICKRNFDYVETVWQHEQQSILHKRMLEAPDILVQAENYFKKLGKKQRTCVPTSAFYQDWDVQLRKSQGAGYRDRALERRQAYNQPKKPSGQPSVGEKRKEPSSTTETNDKEPAAKKNKGMNMLSKMGWATGAGLGAGGAVPMHAIPTDVYAPGSGLGTTGGRLGDAHEEAGWKTIGNVKTFLQKTKDKARERFEQMR
ncbi:putative RNA-binding protein [Podospora fimiseda]|uniref:RNA-binding protein n=1 Tax=Podospora fimiseda TaxID=252190 RepID=A0AAN7C0D2_9PEZI|nr:putative RNA-binding protein [Podospora fimiseda]